ncbi:MAG: 3-methyl-2-oxobutanoate hydroxymethyltransferase, partial [Allorhizobium sp.]
LFNEFKPRFVKHYSELAEVIDKAASDYAAEVKDRVFPGQEHTFQIRPKK